MSLRITGTGSCLPKKTVSNEELSKIVETSDKWIKERTGISKRQICVNETITDLAYEAAVQALESSGTKAEDLGYIICSTIGSDHITPSLACAVGERLNSACPAFDLNAACSGFIYSLDMADSLISTNKADKILIICAEKMSSYTDWTDRSTCVLFGDGAGACVCEKGESLKYLYTDTLCNTSILQVDAGNGNSPFSDTVPRGYLKMDGKEVFKFAVTAFERHIEKAMKAINLNVSDIDMYLLHQANKRIIDFARTRLNQPDNKFPTNVEKFGNISSASIPILLDELLRDNQINKGDRLFLSAFGAGLTSGCCVLEWQ